MNARRALVVAVSCLVPAALFAKEFSSDPKASIIDTNSVRIEKLGFAAGRAPADANFEESMVPAIPIVSIGRIVNLGAKLWTLFNKNEPAVGVQTQYATAIPEGIRHWSQLQGWTPPQGVIYGFSAKNLLGKTVVRARYQVLRSYNGSYNNRGKYLAAVTVQPLDADVSWVGYRLSLSVEIPEQCLINAGTIENPVAAMTVIVKWTISSPLKQTDDRAVYRLTGNGILEEISGPFERPSVEKIANTIAKALQYGLK